MDSTYFATAAQVIPVLLLAGVVESRTINLRAPEGVSDRAWGDPAPAPGDVPALLKHAEASLARKRSRGTRLSDRIYRRLVRPAAWFRGLVLPVVALAGEVAALLALRSGSHAYVWLVDWGLAASIGYLLIPLFVVMISALTSRPARRYKLPTRSGSPVVSVSDWSNASGPCTRGRIRTTPDTASIRHGQRVSQLGTEMPCPVAIARVSNRPHTPRHALVPADDPRATTHAFPAAASGLDAVARLMADARELLLAEHHVVR